MRIKLLPALMLLLGACATATDPEPERYRGHYSWGFETSRFQPCGAEDGWWTSGGDLHARYAEVAERDYEPVYVEVEAEVGPEGRFGHLGAYVREMEVTRVVEVRPARDGDCR